MLYDVKNGEVRILIPIHQVEEGLRLALNQLTTLHKTIINIRNSLNNRALILLLLTNYCVT